MLLILALSLNINRQAKDNLPYKEETLRFLYDITMRLDGGEKEADNNVGRFPKLKGGKPYRYMYRHLVFYCHNYTQTYLLKNTPKMRRIRQKPCNFAPDFELN